MKMEDRKLNYELVVFIINLISLEKSVLGKKMACIYWNYIAQQEEKEKRHEDCWLVRRLRGSFRRETFKNYAPGAKPMHVQCGRWPGHTSWTGARAAIESGRERMKSDVIIKLDRDDSIFTAGDEITGQVEIALTNEVKVKDIIIKFSGISRASWDEQRTFTKGSATSVSRKNAEIHLDEQMSILRPRLTQHRNSRASICSQNIQTMRSSNGEERVVMIPAGTHCFPFQFTLPADLTASFEGKWGHTKYLIKVTLERPWKFDIEREKEFKLNAFVDLNNEPELVRPIGSLGEFEPGLICCHSGLVNAELRVTRRGFVPGESIPFQADIENNSRRKMQDAKVALQQHVTFKIGNISKKTTTIVTALNNGEIPRGETVKWEHDSLLIPAIPPSSTKNMRVIHIKYSIALLIRSSSWEDEFCSSVNIVMGTIGLRRSTITSYLALLGYSTPKGSPSTTPRQSIAAVHGQSLTTPKRRAPRQSCPVLLGLPPTTAKSQTGSGSRVLGTHRGSSPRPKLTRGKTDDASMDSLTLPISMETVGDARRLSTSSYSERHRLGSVKEVEDSVYKWKKENG